MKRGAEYYKRKANRNWELVGKYKKLAKRAEKTAHKAETTYHRIRLTGK